MVIESKRRVAQHWLILAGLAIGATSGLIASELLPPQREGAPNAVLEWIARNVAEFVGQVFLRLIFMVVVPLVFSALTLGVAGIGDVRRLGRVGLKTLIFTLLLSSASVAIGLALANVVRPGDRLSPQKRA